MYIKFDNQNKIDPSIISIFYSTLSLLFLHLFHDSLKSCLPVLRPSVKCHLIAWVIELNVRHYSLWKKLFRNHCRSYLCSILIPFYCFLRKIDNHSYFNAIRYALSTSYTHPLLPNCAIFSKVRQTIYALMTCSKVTPALADNSN